MSEENLQQLARQIIHWGKSLGFQQTGITDVNLASHEIRLAQWLDKGYEGDMSYMSRHGTRRSRPNELVPGTRSVISLRMDYLPGPPTLEPQTVLEKEDLAYVSRYALGRDYHKVIRKRLAALQRQIEDWVQQEKLHYEGSRVFTDSAPVLEKALAEKAGLGWIGKNTLLINSQAGSWFFLGELFTSLELPATPTTQTNHCGSCSACIDICPTKAIIAPYQLDARRCISYLTIELKGSIPLELRPLMGNRVFGCDDCQLICPWNKFSRYSSEPDFSPRQGLDAARLLSLLNWSEDEFLKRTQGSAIRRTGYTGWRRNMLVALGNAAPHPSIIQALEALKQEPLSALLSEHLNWALESQQRGFRTASTAESDPCNT